MKKRQLAEDEKQEQTPMQNTNDQSSSSSGVRRNWRGEPMNDQGKSKEGEGDWETIAKNNKITQEASTSTSATPSSSSSHSISQQITPGNEDSHPGMDIDHINSDYQNRVTSNGSIL